MSDKLQAILDELKEIKKDLRMNIMLGTMPVFTHHPTMKSGRMMLWEEEERAKAERRAMLDAEAARLSKKVEALEAEIWESIVKLGNKVGMVPFIVLNGDFYCQIGTNTFQNPESALRFLNDLQIAKEVECKAKEDDRKWNGAKVRATLLNLHISDAHDGMRKIFKLAVRDPIAMFPDNESGLQRAHEFITRFELGKQSQPKEPTEFEKLQKRAEGLG